MSLLPQVRGAAGRSPSPMGSAVPDLLLEGGQDKADSGGASRSGSRPGSRAASPIGTLGRTARGASPAGQQTYMDLLNIPGALQSSQSGRRSGQDSLSPVAHELIDSVRKSRSPSPILEVSRTDMLPLPKPFRFSSGPDTDQVVAAAAQEIGSPTSAIRPTATPFSPPSKSGGLSKSPLATPASTLDRGQSPAGEKQRAARDPDAEAKRWKELTGAELRILGRATLMVMHCKLTPEEEQMVARQFKTASETGELGGSLNEEQFRKCLDVWSVPRKLSDFVFKAFDRDGSHSVEFHEYLSAISLFLRGSFDDKVRFFFGLWDENNDGTMSGTELRHFLSMCKTHSTVDDVEVDHLLERMDSDGNGEISFLEFLAGVHKFPRLNLVFHQCFGEL